ncbi:MAG: P1 family peptidase [Gemmatimonadetes bacterium]|nr:P1 family peptidase [Gemmatimonadota bacterium]
MPVALAAIYILATIYSEYRQPLSCLYRRGQCCPHSSTIRKRSPVQPCHRSFRATFSVVRIAGLIALNTVAAAPTASARQAEGLTAIPGIRVGHFTLSERPTGCTVVLVERGAVGGVDVRGAAPGTRETDLLAPMNTVQQVHAVVLSGGSAFGLAVADGVMRYLEARQIGFDVGVARVPIVPAAILFDLDVGGRPDVRPTAECGYRAAEAATTGPVAEGNVGAGAGATVGKLLGGGRAMKAGIGSAARELASGLIVAVLVAVNAVGDVIDPSSGEVVAGARTEDGLGLVDVRNLIREGFTGNSESGRNTTLAVVATNALLDKAQINKVAQMAHDGLARAIFPVHTPWDGDVIFSLATGDYEGEGGVFLIGALAADLVAEAVVRAVRAAEGIPGYPAVRDLTSR